MLVLIRVNWSRITVRDPVAVLVGVLGEDVRHDMHVVRGLGGLERVDDRAAYGLARRAGEEREDVARGAVADSRRFRDFFTPPAR